MLQLVCCTFLYPKRGNMKNIMINQTSKILTQSAVFIIFSAVFSVILAQIVYAGCPEQGGVPASEPCGIANVDEVFRNRNIIYFLRLNS